jgi:hypothetical protein
LGSGSQAMRSVLSTVTQKLPDGQWSSTQSPWPSHAESLPQTSKQRTAPPWMGLQTVSRGHSLTSPARAQGEVQ